MEQKPQDRQERYSLEERREVLIHLIENIADENELNLPTIYINDLEERDHERRALGVTEYLEEGVYEIRIGGRRFDNDHDLYLHEAVHSLLIYNNPYYRELFLKNINELQNLSIESIRTKGNFILNSIIADELYSEFVGGYVGQQTEIEINEVISSLVNNFQEIAFHLSSFETHRLIVSLLTDVTAEMAAGEDIENRYLKVLSSAQANARNVGQAAANSLLIARDSIPDISQNLDNVNMFYIHPFEFLNVLQESSKSKSARGFVRRLTGGLKYLQS